MVTALLYIFNALVLIALGVKSLVSYKKSSSNIISKRFIGIGFVTAAAYLLLVVDIFFESIGKSRLSVIFDAAAITFFYWSMTFAARMAGDLLHNQKIVKKINFLLMFLGVFVALSTLQSQQTTIITESGIVNYRGVPVATEIFSYSVMAVYTWAFVILIRAGMNNSHIKRKLYLLGAGFLVSTWSGAVLIVADSFTKYIVTYSILSFGYVLQLIGILITVSSEKPLSKRKLYYKGINYTG